MNLGDSAGGALQLRPNADGLENSAAAVRQCRGALIETRLCRGVMRELLDERDFELERRQGYSQSGPNPPPLAANLVVPDFRHVQPQPMAGAVIKELLVLLLAD